MKFILTVLLLWLTALTVVVVTDRESSAKQALRVRESKMEEVLDCMEKYRVGYDRWSVYEQAVCAEYRIELGPEPGKVVYYHDIIEETDND